jgi:hypothetical protein
MRWGTCGLSAVLLVLLVIVSGCRATSTRSTVILPSSAYFNADPGELKALQALAKSHEARMKTCAKSPQLCEEAYYGRGLVALFKTGRMKSISFKSCTRRCRIADIRRRP